MNRSLATVIAALLIAAGLTAGGWLAGDGFARGRATDRYVTVKGVAEREVEADLALWPLRFIATDDSLPRAQAALRSARQAVLAFLADKGIGSDEVQVQAVEVVDRLAERYQSGVVESRFIVAETLMVRSSEPRRIESASQAIGELVDAGVVLAADGPWNAGPSYLFNGLNDVKPAMIAEATANARLAAEQFARDSGTTLAGIRFANQGVFVILPRDNVPGMSEERQPRKTVRVVTTVEYLLAES